MRRGSLEAIVGIVPQEGSRQCDDAISLQELLFSSTVTEDNSSVEDSIFVSHLRGISEKMCECCKNGTQQSASERYNGCANGWTIRGMARSLPAF